MLGHYRWRERSPEKISGGVVESGSRNLIQPDRRIIGLFAVGLRTRGFVFDTLSYGESSDTTRHVGVEPWI